MIFQSTLPRGSDLVADDAMKNFIISIHAPSRERLTARRSALHCSIFQSTLPRGSDCDIVIHNPSAIGISIHAPSRERPVQRGTAMSEVEISIHAPSRERPAVIDCKRLEAKEFQSTLPRGSDINSVSKQTNDVEFQSTLPRGSDGTIRREYRPPEISIHAPSRERRSLPLVGPSFASYFNPRSLAGATKIKFGDVYLI